MFECGYGDIFIDKIIYDPAYKFGRQFEANNKDWQGEEERIFQS